MTDARQILRRRRALFSRVTAARDAAPYGTSERDRLDDAAARATQRLSAAAQALTPITGETTPLRKWRVRLLRERRSLRAAHSHLDLAHAALQCATADVFSDVPLIRVRTEKRFIPDNCATHCVTAAQHIEDAREASNVASRCLPITLPAQLRLRTIARRTAVSALESVVGTRRRITMLESQCNEQLAALAASHASVLLDKEHSPASSSCSVDSMRQLPELKRALNLLLTLAPPA